MTEAWTAPQVERTGPGRILSERQALEAWLDFHRDMRAGAVGYRRSAVAA
jgi:hypothetical protein